MDDQRDRASDSDSHHARIVAESALMCVTTDCLPVVLTPPASAPETSDELAGVPRIQWT
jgi:hypothetical protein